ncbi:type II toxin-antitoxin system HigB family toxin [Martelella mangrovi]|uniref:mRNA interferase HigB n=1 Tax=Martelella mangrovi TaxID=1397477 RepID=A0ABV2I6M6_9HYPH
MRIIKTLHLHDYAREHPDAAAAIENWIMTVRRAEWRRLQDVSDAFSKVKLLGADRARFEIAGGDYRLIAAFDFHRQAVFIKFIGTHAEYDRIDAHRIAQFRRG